MKLMSTAFENEGKIPIKYTCEGSNISPPLSWEGIPENAQVLSLVVDDPDSSSGKFVHWILYNLPKVPAELEEGASLSSRFSEGLREGINSFGEQGYNGPCPPRGDKEHRYVFHLFALRKKLNAGGRIKRDQLMALMAGKIIDKAQLMAKYRRI